MLYRKSAILGLSFLDPKDLCLPNQFSRGSWQKRSVSTYLTWCQRRNWVASMIELTLIFNPSYVCRPTIWTFSGQHLFQNFLGVSEQNSANLGINWLYKTIIRLSHLFQYSWAFALFYKSIFKTTFSFFFSITLKTYPYYVST